MLRNILLHRFLPDILSTTSKTLQQQGCQKFLSSSLSSIAVSNRAEREYTQHTPSLNQARSIHQTPHRFIKFTPPDVWLRYNEVVFAPTKEGEKKRPAEVYHQRTHVKYQFDKMMYLCRMIRGMSVDEAKKQLTFKSRAGAALLKEVIEEAQDMGVESHNVEYKHNMWIAEVFPTHAGQMQGRRIHGKGKGGQVTYRFIHLFIKLREGTPPDSYYPQMPTASEHIERYISSQRKRRIYNAL